MTEFTSEVTARPFNGDVDFWRVRDLLIDTYPLTPPDFNWEVRRWDGNRFHREQDKLIQESKNYHVWETASGELAGVVNTEGGIGHAYLQLHPDYRHLIEADMVAWAESHLTEVTDDGKQQLSLFVYEYDLPRRLLLEKRGYEKSDDGGVVRRLRFGKRPLPAPVFPSPYQMRPTKPDSADYQRIADVINAGFNRTTHTAAEVGRFMTEAPCFRHDLDLVAVAPDGSFAAYVGVILEPSNRYGLFEPVCTHPAHRRQGLAQALMFEGLQRLKALGAQTVYVATGDMVPANRLYDSIGFTEMYQGYWWRKQWVN